jgi:probable rRNA maturation factor
LSILIRDARWRRVRGLGSRLKQAVVEALAEGAAADADLTILLTTDRHMQSLNRSFRKKDQPTNVLSFPSGAQNYLGDVAIGYGVTAREAKAGGKSVRDHAVHLAVHGTLHLLGFDHVAARQAAVMEAKEVRILEKLKIADPYAKGRA